MRENANAGRSADPLAGFHSDRRAKYAAGRAAYGPTWAGDPGGPIAEAYLECLDLWNYADKAAEIGQIDARTGRRWKRQAMTLGVEIRAQIEARATPPATVEGAIAISTPAEGVR